MSRSTSGCGCSELAALLALAACGDPIVGADYVGEPMLSISGSVLVDAPIDATSVGVAVVWHGGAYSRPAPEERLTTRTAFPAWYQIDLLAPPPRSAIHELPGSGGGLGSIGLVLVYDDQNGSGRIEFDIDPVLGVAAQTAVMWFEPPAGDGAGPPPGEPPPQGFGVMRRDDAVCAGGAAPLIPVDSDAVDLVMGDFCGAVIDPDCDPESWEWGGLCRDGAPPGGPP